MKAHVPALQCWYIKSAQLQQLFKLVPLLPTQKSASHHTISQRPETIFSITFSVIKQVVVSTFRSLLFGKEFAVFQDSAWHHYASFCWKVENWSVKFLL